MEPIAPPKAFRYAELGNVIKRWRQNKYRSATSLCDAAKFSFSYGVYAAYERGEDLPPPKAILEIAAFLQEDPREAIVVWAQTQMPTPELREFFSIQHMLGERRQPADRGRGAQGPYSISSNSIPPSEFDNTWVFDVPERKAIEAHPWLITFFIALGVTFPDEVPFEMLGLKTNLAVQNFIRNYIHRWIEDERIVASKEGFRLAKQYFHIPKNDEWQDVRKGMLADAIKSMAPQLTPAALKARTCHRTLTTRILTEGQRLDIMERLARLESEFFSVPYVGNNANEDKKAYTFLMLLAPRSLLLPENVRAGKKKA